MLQKLEVRKGVVHAVLNQALGKVMAVLSVLSEMAMKLLSKACPTCSQILIHVLYGMKCNVRAQVHATYSNRV